MTDRGWERRIAEAWATFDSRSDDENRALIEALAAELPADSAVASFERACVFDSTGRSELAVPLYREALERGLSAARRRRAVIQLASSLRNVGRAEESVALLTAELDAERDELDDAVRGFLALALADLGREREAVCTRSPRSRRTSRATSDRSRTTPRTSSTTEALEHATSRYPSAINATPATTSAAPPRRAGPTRSPASGAARNAAMRTLVSRTDATAAADARRSAASTSA